MTTTITLNARELAHVLAALRHTQRVGTDAAIHQCGFFDDLTPLSEEDVDALCERINVEDAPPQTSPTSEPTDQQATDEAEKAGGYLNFTDLMADGVVVMAPPAVPFTRITTYVTAASSLGFKPGNWPSVKIWVRGHLIDFRPIRDIVDGGRVYGSEAVDREIVVLND